MEVIDSEKNINNNSLLGNVIYYMFAYNKIRGKKLH